MTRESSTIRQLRPSGDGARAGWTASGDALTLSAGAAGAAPPAGELERLIRP
jgi:hypothetical protein